MKKKTKTSEKQLLAAKKYDSGFDRIVARLPKGTVEKIHDAGYDSVNIFTKEAVLYRLAHPEADMKLPVKANGADRKGKEEADEPVEDQHGGDAGSPVLPGRKEDDLVSIPEE